MVNLKLIMSPLNLMKYSMIFHLILINWAFSNSRNVLSIMDKILPDINYHPIYKNIF
jgi:hypothetical protein